jgi:solute carrier family 25 folate transporter 32
MIASMCTYPHEVIRTRLQIQHTVPEPRAALAQPLRSAGTIFSVCAAIWRTEGLPGFYRGLSVNLIRTVPSSALTLLTYEVLMRKLVPLTHNTPRR